MVQSRADEATKRRTLATMMKIKASNIFKSESSVDGPHNAKKKPVGPLMQTTFQKDRRLRKSKLLNAPRESSDGSFQPTYMARHPSNIFKVMDEYETPRDDLVQNGSDADNAAVEVSYMKDIRKINKRDSDGRKSGAKKHKSRYRSSLNIIPRFSIM